MGRIEIGFVREESVGLCFPEGKGGAFPFREAPRFRIRSRWGRNSIIYGSKRAPALCGGESVGVGRLLMSDAFGITGPLYEFWRGQEAHSKAVWVHS